MRAGEDGGFGEADQEAQRVQLAGGCGAALRKGEDSPEDLKSREKPAGPEFVSLNHKSSCMCALKDFKCLPVIGAGLQGAFKPPCQTSGLAFVLRRGP